MKKKHGPHQPKILFLQAMGLIIFSTMLSGTTTIDIYQTQLVNNEFTNPIKLTVLFDNDKYWKSIPVFSQDGN